MSASNVDISTPSCSKDSDLSVRVKIINETSNTPLPSFDTMDDKEINMQLSQFGLRPIGRAKAIRLLKRIYEAVHPVTDVGTPLTKRVSRALIRTQKRPAAEARAEKAREKRIRKAISNMPFSSALQPSGIMNNGAENTIFSVTEQITLSAASAGDTINLPLSNIPKWTNTACAEESHSNIAISELPQQKGDLTRTFLDWLRSPENEELYYELLTLNPVLFEKLTTEFGKELRLLKISRPKFAEMLDRIHVTYCVPQHDNGHY